MTLKSPEEIVASVRRAIQATPPFPVRVFEWSKRFDKTKRVESIWITCLGRLSLIQCISTFSNKYDPNGKIPLDQLLVGDESSNFTAFPSIHGDIRENFSLHAGGELETPTYVFALTDSCFPEPALASSRLLSLAVRKMIEPKDVSLSEISSPFARGVVAFTSRLRLVNQLYFFPTEAVADVKLVLELLGLFIAEYQLAARLPMADRAVIVQHLKTVAEKLGSRPLEAQGALESLISKMEAAITDDGESEGSDEPDDLDSLESEAPAVSTEAAFARICDELQRITRLELVVRKRKEHTTEQFTRVEVLFQFPPGGVPAPGSNTPRLTLAIEEFGHLLAGERDYHSVR